MTPPLRTDVTIVGSGPAGSLAAALLAQKGYEVTLIEKAHHPRPAVGENVLPHAWKFLDLAGASQAIADEGFVAKAGGTVAWNGQIRQMAFRDFGYDRPALHVERDRFDELLFRAAQERGATTCEGILATAVSRLAADDVAIDWRSDDGVTGTLTSRVLLDASGQRALVSRHLGQRRIEATQRMVAAWGYYRDAAYVDASGAARPHSRLHEVPPTTFVAALGGGAWSWHIALRESTSVGLVLPAGEVTAGATPEARAAWFDGRARAVPQLDRLLEPGQLVGDVRVIRDYSYRADHFAGPGYLLLGDAAAFVDPIFSLGVTFALYTAYLAAWAVDRGFSKPARRDSAFGIYGGQVDRRIELARALALPRYAPSGGGHAAARDCAAFESDAERALRQTAATLTERSLGLDEVGSAAATHYRELAAISF